MKKSLLSSFLILAMVTASSLLFVNCTGADGAVGPAGPAGQTGNANVIQFSFAART